MSEILRYVTLEEGGRPVTLLDIDNMSTLMLVRESFAFNAGTKQPITSTANRRYGGKRQTGETTDNASYAFKVLVKGTSQDECTALIEQLLSQIEANPSTLLIEWRPDGATHTTYREVRGTGTWKCLYEWSQFVGAQSIVYEVTIPVEPLAKGLPMDIGDTFAVDTRGDYEYQSGHASNEEVALERIRAVANVSEEIRAIHIARGYKYADNQQTLKAAPYSTITGFKMGVILKMLSSTTYLVAYIEDNGTQSILKIDLVLPSLPGGRSTLESGALPGRLKSGVYACLRGRIEGNLVTAEAFILPNEPTPMGAPNQSISHTLSTEAETGLGAAIEGYAGRMWIPVHEGASIDEYTVEPFTYRDRTLPQVIPLGGRIPGTAPATADITITTEGGADPPVSAVLGWGAPTVPGTPPFGVFAATGASSITGWTEAANAEALGGSLLLDKTVSSRLYSLAIPVFPSVLAPDAFTTDEAIEVWARVLLDATLIAPVLTLSSQSAAGAEYGATRYSDEWGQAGKVLTPIAVNIYGSAAFRFIKLGTLRMSVSPEDAQWLIIVEGTLGLGSTGEWGIDYLLMMPSTARACSPTSKPNDNGYPPFIVSTNETSKTIRSDLSAVVAKPGEGAHPDHGLGGQLIELPTGAVQLLVKLSSLAPDDPTIDATSEQTTHAATVHAAITPRWQMLRSS